MTPPLVLGSEHGCSPCSRAACDAKFGLAVATRGRGGSWCHSPGDTGEGSGGSKQRWHLWDGLCGSERGWTWMRATGGVREPCLPREASDAAEEKGSTS